MSRWVDQFKSHPFQATWSDLKRSIISAGVDDQTVITSVTELARLKKVSSYLDEMINGIDPELVPMSTWDAFNQQAVACHQQIVAYNSNRNIVQIQNANAHADNLLTYVRPYMVAPGDIGNVLREAIAGYATVIDEYGESFRRKSTDLVNAITQNNDQSAKLLAEAEATKARVKQYHAALFGKEGADGGMQEKVKKLVDDFETKNKEISAYYNKIFVANQNEPSTTQEIEQAKKEILSKQEEIEKLLKNVGTRVANLDKFHDRIFGDSKGDDPEVPAGGLAGELRERVLALSEFEEKQQNKYTALNAQIEALLPGATSAGLASAYHDMKKSFDDPIKKMSRIFYGAIGLLVFASLVLAIEKVEPWSINFVKIGDWDTVLKSVVNKIPFYVPILWLAFYASNRRSEYQRLQQEYSHKEALAKSYDKYRAQIEQLDDKDPEMQKAFIMKAIDAIAYNASATLDGKHGDKLPTLAAVEKALGEMQKIRDLIKPFGEVKKSKPGAKANAEAEE